MDSNTTNNDYGTLSLVNDNLKTEFKIQGDINYPNLSSHSPPRVLDTKDNLKYLLDQFGISVRYNEMARCREIVIPGISLLPDEKENAALNYVDHIAALNLMPRTRIDIHLNTLAWENSYHPIVECIANNPWDKTLRLDQFISCVKTNNQEISHRIIKTWMVAAIAAAHAINGFANQGVLVLQGKQRIGKTKWAKSLTPLNCNAIKEGAIIDANNKDTILSALQFWLVELGELDATFRKDIARLKSFITTQVHVIRKVHARRDSYLNTRTAYIATVNESNFLVDTTGNRRWWVVSVEGFDFDHGLDMQQVWAEVYDLWQEGHDTDLDNELHNIVNESNKEYEKLDSIKELILEYFDWESLGRTDMTCLEVLNKLGYIKPTNLELTKAAYILTEINGKGYRKSNGKKLHSIPTLCNRKILV